MVRAVAVLTVLLALPILERAVIPLMPLAVQV
jgi:hypothetical protein